MMSKGALSSITDSSASSSSGRNHRHSSEKFPVVLFGRDEEFSKLFLAYQRVTEDTKYCRNSTPSGIFSSNSSHAEAVLVHGLSGVGKTSFVDLLQEPVFASQGFVCMGKFFQDAATQEPYSAFLAALSDLCDLVYQYYSSEEEKNMFDDRKKEIKNALRGPDGIVLSKVISSLATILDYTPEDLMLSSNEQAPNFPVACKKFLCTMASPAHPVVVVLDDIQWMDEGSRQLIELLMKQEEGAGGLPNLLFVFLYRDEEADSIDQLFQHRKAIVDIQLKNLSESQIHKMVSDYLKEDGGNNDVRALSSLIYLRTAGNPFHTSQFLEMLERDGLLVHKSYEVDINSDELTWEFDIEKIQLNTTPPESLADVLWKKNQHLDKEVLHTLQVASILGTRFKAGILKRVFETLIENKAATSEGDAMIPNTRDCIHLESHLTCAVQMGFIEMVNHGSYQFSHDKIQAALQDMIDVMNRREIHKAVAETYRRNGDPESDYHAAVHFNEAKAIFMLDSERLQIARINVAASKYCNRTSAFYTSAILLRESIGYISQEKKWTTNYNLTLEIYNLLLREELSIGNYDACTTISDEIFLHAKSPEDTITSWVTIVESELAQYNSRKCMDSAEKAMKVLGVILPAKVGPTRVLRKLLRIKYMLRGQTDEGILSLPLLSDEVRAMQVKVLLYDSVSGMIANEPGRSGYSALLAMEICLMEGGLSPYIPSAFAIYSVAELAMGNRDRAYRYGRLAMSMLDQMDCRETVAPALLLVTTLVIHWRQHVRDLVSPLKRCITSGLESGNTFFAITGAANYVGVRFFKGDSLVELEEYIRIAYQNLNVVANDEVKVWLKPYFQQIVNLRASSGNWRSLTDLTGEFMDESDYIRAAIASNDKVQLSVLWLCKLPLAYHFHLFTLAESVLMDLSQNWQSFRSSYTYMIYNFYGSLTYVELFRARGQRKYLRMAKRCRRTLEKPPTPNSTPLVALLLAEEKSVQTRNVATLEKLYGAAIQAMASAGFPHNEALANERAGFLFCKLGHQIKAERYFIRAMELYEFEWGATAKLEWLQEQSRALLAVANAGKHNVRNELVGNMIVLEERSSEFTAN